MCSSQTTSLPLPTTPHTLLLFAHWKCYNFPVYTLPSFPYYFLLNKGPQIQVPNHKSDNLEDPKYKDKYSEWLTSSTKVKYRSLN